MMSCVNTVEYTVLINGRISKGVQPSRGLRQGDPLSPYLFILGAEFLTRLIAEMEDKGEIHGIKVHRNASPISHIMDADDLLIMSRANEEEASAIRNCFDLYYSWSGQKENWEKSSIMFSKNTDRMEKKII